MTELDNVAMPLDRQVNAVMGWWSQKHQSRRASGSVHNRILPLQECHVRHWLREVYPSQFNPALDQNAEQDASLELEEVRALFRMVINDHIQQDWFETSMFSPSLAEALGLLLRNQVDRFTKTYYQQASLPFPDGGMR